jgi:hypothetical protein
MYLKLLTILFLFVAGTVKAQPSGKPPPIEGPSSKQHKINEYNRSCLFRNKYTVSQRRAFYPFYKASTIKLVSFPCKEEGICGLPKNGNRVLFNQLKEIKTLSLAQVDELTNILYNYSFRGKFDFEIEKLCYKPRNAILFFDDKGKSFAYIELCFECRHSEPSSPKIKLGDNCAGKYQLLQNFFAKSGITYGVRTKDFTFR